LKTGATLQQAQAQVNALNEENLERFSEIKEVQRWIPHRGQTSLQDMLIAGIKRILYLLWGGALLVLLIGGLNMANLALARLALRRKEIATRIALGAGRAQLMRQLMVENLGLAFVGGLGGVALGAGRGAGACLFKRLLTEYNLWDAWNRFKQVELRQMAIQWCEENGITFRQA
jgi:putative ABC transport system permease protein